MTGEYASVLKNRTFAIFFGGQTVSTIGDVLFTFSVMWAVMKRTDSPLDVTVVPLVSMLIATFTSIPMATLADRLPRKLALVGSDVFRALSIAIIAFLFWNHRSTVLELYAANVVIQFAGQLFGPAISGVLPEILNNAKAELAAANALMSMTGQSVSFFAYAVGGVLIATLGVKMALLVDAISFAVSALSLWVITMPDTRELTSIRILKASERIRAFARDMVVGFDFILNRKNFVALIIFIAAANLVANAFTILTVPYSAQVLHGTARIYGLLQMADLAGGLIGAYLAGKYSNRLKLWQWAVIALVGTGGSLIGLGVIATFPTAVLFLIVLNVVMTLFNIPFMTSVQLLVPESMRGRVMTTFVFLISGLSSPIGLVLGGWLMTKYGIRPVLVATGTALIMLALTSFKVASFREDPDLQVGFTTTRNSAAE